ATLRSQFNPFNEAIDASSSRLENDMKRLVWAAYVFNRNMLQDTARAPDGKYISHSPNVFRNKSDRNLREGSGDFVVTSANVVTISLHVLVAVPIVLVVLIILQIVCMLLPMSSSSDVRSPDQSWWGYFWQHLNDLHSPAFQKIIEETLSTARNYVSPDDGRSMTSPLDTRHKDDPELKNQMDIEEQTVAIKS
ncbi:hypothetical protein RUND412_007520, partial [Rhizina undulata]